MLVVIGETGVIVVVDVCHLQPFHSLHNLKNQFSSVAFCRNSEAYNVSNGTVLELPIVILLGGGQFFSTLLSVMLSIAVLIN